MRSADAHRTTAATVETPADRVHSPIEAEDPTAVATRATRPPWRQRIPHLRGRDHRPEASQPRVTRRSLRRRVAIVLALVVGLLLSLYLSVTVSPAPENSFWVERNDAVMPVWVRGNIESGVFVIFNHGGPGSSGTLESIIEANPGDGQLGQESPFKILEEDYAVVYWDQRHSGLSKGDVDPNDSQPDDFGLDLAAVVDAISERHDPDRLFLVGQSWGHFVALNYLTSLDSWPSNQAMIDGYIGYKGNHEQGMAYEVAREALVAHAESSIEVGTDVEYWQGVVDFYQARPVLAEVSDYWTHYMYLDEVMGGSISVPDRISASVRASFLSPFNGFTYYSNNRATNQAEEFMELVVTDRSIRTTIDRLSVPTLLVYGRGDLIAPVEVGESIYREIGTSPEHKDLLVLEDSRHGAEGDDRPILQDAVIDFIEAYS